MTDLILRLVEFLTTWFWHLSPFVVCGDDRCGVIRRFGVYHRDLVPGLNAKWPIVEAHLEDSCALESTMLAEQSLTSRDNVQVTLRGVITYKVVNPRKYILETATAASVVNDVGCCVVSEVAPRFLAASILRGKLFPKRLLRAMRRRSRKWGIEVSSVGLVDRVQARTYRLINSNSEGHHGASQFSG